MLNVTQTGKQDKSARQGVNFYQEWNPLIGFHGKTIKKVTKEQDENGNEYTIVAEFKDYDSISDGVKDHNELLNKPWNKPVREACDNNDPYEACRQLYKCGYATSQDYSDELIAIIDEYNLTQYDPKYE